MARDTEKNAYFYVGIPRDSHTYLHLQEEAAETGISIPKLLALRVSDWYRGNSRQPNVPPVAATIREREAQEVSPEDYRAVAASNATAALSEWL